MTTTITARRQDLNGTSKDYKIDEDELTRFVVWPDKKLEPSEIRKIFEEVNRFIDFDQTIAMKAGRIARPTLRGKPTAEFLAEESYIVQTWNPDGAVEFFTKRYPEFPKPVLIMMVPMFRFESPQQGHNLGKNFAALSITGKTIIDDFLAEEMHAPGCIILQPDL
ncbi:MAG: hypothetical protein Q7S19_02955 [bacterium]|nr:hypothetical protein [bacterium]